MHSVIRVWSESIIGEEGLCRKLTQYQVPESN